MVVPPAGWICHSRPALTVCSCSVGSGRWCWLKCCSVPSSLAGSPRHSCMAPTAPWPQLPLHTWCDMSFPVCLPSREEGPTSAAAQSHYGVELLDWRGLREALWETEGKDMPFKIGGQRHLQTNINKLSLDGGVQVNVSINIHSNITSIIIKQDIYWTQGCQTHLI